MTTARNRTNMNEIYAMSSIGPGAVKRIRTPHPHDVLSGRGGGINSHIGNKNFREWVRERKESYNLAGSKAEKARVANKVIDLVRSQSPPGRFLQRESGSVSGPSWWVEVDEVRALAKTSQALREGAPQIRAAHKDELVERVERFKKSKRKKTQSANVNAVKTGLTAPSLRAAQSQTVPTPLSSMFAPLPRVPIRVPFQSSAPHTRSDSTDKALKTLQKNVEEAKSLAERQTPANIANVQPLMSNRQFSEKYGPPSKKRKPEQTAPNTLEKEFDSSAETPPLTSAHPFQDMSALSLGIQSTIKVPRENGSSNSDSGFLRSHSLALSDLSIGELLDGDEEFVNPFADESDIINTVDESKTHPQRVLRNLSSDETRNNHCENNNNILGVRNRPSPGSMSSRYVNKSAHPMRRQVLSENDNCFCDCAISPEGVKDCICGDLADHLLHRRDGLSLFLHEIDFV